MRKMETVSMNPGADIMGIHKRLGHGLVAILFFLSLSAKSATAADALQVRYQWTELDFNWPDEETQLIFAANYTRENNNPMGIEVAGDRLFITIPRWESGVLSTLNYIYLNDTSESPLLNPYPSWDAHRYDGDNIPEVVSTFRVWADNCDRLWVLDSGIDVRMETRQQILPPALVVYNLTTDQVLRYYVLPTDQTVTTSHFANVVVEDYSCDDSFAYLADIDNPAIVVYSWASNDSWLVQHHYFYPDPLAGHFNTSGLFYQWWDGVINLALASEGDGYSTLYFSPLCSNEEFSVSTRILRDSELASSSSSFHEFVWLGSRGSNGQGAASYLDPTTGILFHALSIGNSIACWNPTSDYEASNVARFHSDNTTLVFPGDIKVDADGNIWTISNRLQTFMYGDWDSESYNYRVLTGTVAEAIAGTPCSYGTRASATVGLLSILVFLVFTLEGRQSLFRIPSNDALS